MSVLYCPAGLLTAALLSCVLYCSAALTCCCCCPACCPAAQLGLLLCCSPALLFSWCSAFSLLLFQGFACLASLLPCWLCCLSVCYVATRCACPASWLSCALLPRCSSMLLCPVCPAALLLRPAALLPCLLLCCSAALPGLLLCCPPCPVLLPRYITLPCLLLCCSASSAALLPCYAAACFACPASWPCCSAALPP